MRMSAAGLDTVISAPNPFEIRPGLPLLVRTLGPSCASHAACLSQLWHMVHDHV